jgi:hypothetical protein
MFTIPRVNVIQSSEGFSVEVLGFTGGLLYMEGEKKIHIRSELLAGSNPALALYTSSIKAWDPPSENEAISDIKRNEIVENIRRAFRFRGFEIEVY